MVFSVAKHIDTFHAPPIASCFFSPCQALSARLATLCPVNSVSKAVCQIYQSHGSYGYYIHGLGIITMTPSPGENSGNNTHVHTTIRRFAPLDFCAFQPRLVEHCGLGCLKPNMREMDMGNHGNSSPEFLGLKENMYESNSCGTMGLFHPLIIQI